MGGITSLVIIFSLASSQVVGTSAQEKLINLIFSNGAYLPIILRNYCPGVFADSFDNPFSGWITIDDESVTMEYRRFSENMLYSTLAKDSKDIFAIDLDLDGDKDLLTSAAPVKGIVWWKNDGHSSFKTSKLLADSAASAISANDLDNDGDLDIVGGYSEIYWGENDGHEFFEKRIVNTDFPEVGGIYTADLDQDNDVDILATSEDDSSIMVWENDGTPQDGGWIDHLVCNDLSMADAAFAADIDGDTDLDILGSGNLSIRWWENNGKPDTSTWTEHKVGSANGIRDIFPADLDHDGDLDVIGAVADVDLIAWWENDGTPKDIAWDRHIVSNQFDFAYSVITADGDGNGTMDIFATALGEDSIAWWENNGESNFIEHRILEGSLDLSDIDAGDILGDSAIDIVAVNPSPYPPHVALLENRPEYRIFMKQSGLWVAASPGIKTPDAVFEVEVANASNVFGSYGLLFGLSEDWEEFYTFEIAPDGQFSLWCFDSNSGWKELFSGSSSWINPGAATNYLKIERNGDTINAFANGHHLATVENEKFTGPRLFGLIASTYNLPGLDVRFDNFIAYPLTCTSNPITFTGPYRTGEDLISHFESWEVRVNNRDDVGTFP